MAGFVFVLCLLCFAQSCIAQENSTDATQFPVLQGPYLGQKPPGMEPELFAPGILPTEGVQHCFPSFSPDGREVYWMTVPEPRTRVILFMAEQDGQWSPPRVAPFSGEFIDQSPCFSPDGSRLYFSSNRPGGHGRMDIWYLQKTDSGWSAPVNPGSPPNSDQSETQPSVTADGTIYFVGAMDSVEWNRGIYRSRFVDGKYLDREALDTRINTTYADAYPFIAPDGSYLLFGSSRPGAKSVETDLYISYRADDGSWMEPRQLDEGINNGFTVSFACVTHDGKYLIFNRFDESKTDVFFWVDSEIIKPHTADTSR
jgi:Tol biopolymer transport system component